MQLDTSGNLIAEATDAAASFVWGLSCTSNNGKVSPPFSAVALEQQR